MIGTRLSLCPIKVMETVRPTSLSLDMSVLLTVRCFLFPDMMISPSPAFSPALEGCRTAARRSSGGASIRSLLLIGGGRWGFDSSFFPKTSGGVIRHVAAPCPSPSHTGLSGSPATRKSQHSGAQRSRRSHFAPKRSPEAGRQSRRSAAGPYAS